jgi:AraC-like DNA-binding protein
MASPTVLDFNLRGLLAVWPLLGHDTHALFEAAGVAYEAVEPPRGEVAVADLTALWATAQRLDGQPALGLRIAQALPFGLYQLLEFLAANSPTVGDGVRRVTAYIKVVTTAIDMHVEQADDGWRLVLSNREHPGFLNLMIADYALGLLALRGRYAFSSPLPISAVEYALADPRDGADRAAVFEAPVRFNARRYALVFSEATWSTPLPGHSPALYAAAEAHAETLLRQSPAPTIAGALREALRGALATGEPTLTRTARQLGMSGRTLQRRLAAEGTTFAESLTALRRSEAERLLTQTAPTLADIAHRLGFAEQSAFQRAFRRWTGETPAGWRRARQRRDGSVP